MAVNQVELKIGGTNGEDGKDYSKFVTFPIKWNSLLDVQLDEGLVSLVRCPVELFKPLTPVYLRVYNEGSGREYKKYFVVNADNADEIPAGSGKWNHDLRLIENTKKLERIVCPSMGFVNPIKKSVPKISTNDWKVIKDSSWLGNLNPTPNYSITYPYDAGEKIAVPMPTDVFLDWSSEYERISGFSEYRVMLFGKTTISNGGVIEEYTEDMWNKPIQYFYPKQGVIIITVELNAWEYDVDNPPAYGQTDYDSIHFKNVTTKTVQIIVSCV